MISAIIAIYKPEVSRLFRCLAAVLPQVDEVVIVGDADSPWPPQGLPVDYKIKLVRHPEVKTGYGKKATLGAMESKGDFLWFANDDMFANSDVMEKCMAEMRDGVAVVTHTLRSPDGRIQYAGKFRLTGATGFMHEDFGKPKSRHTAPVEQESACGASMLVRREAFMKIGGFDERYLLLSEDDDLCMSVRKLGWKVIFTPHCEGIHEAHSSLSITPGWRKTMHESAQLFRAKWLDYFKRNPNPNVLGKF